jgi:GalNAc-alpha-(1->4)-GalNAc-alpha-(1->3)-diNAcBac-PP-undecaprenol alpha-1,4-N-acetyl-D-galactosaminyltransferase
MSPVNPHKPPRILLAILSLSAGGSERVISEMANWWSAKDHEVALLTFWGKENDHYKLDSKIQRFELDFWRQSKTPWQYILNRIRLLFRIRQTVQTFKPDTVISFIDLINIIMVIALAGTKIPLIVCERTDPRQHPISRSRSFARVLSYPFSSGLVVQTSSVAEWAKTIIPASKIEVIPNFVRMLPETQNPQGQEESKQPYILAMGRLDKHKGYDLLIQGFAAAKTSHAEWRLVILGDGPERSNLEELASCLGIRDDVMMPGVVGEPTDWLRKAFFFVHPSRYEGFPNAILEAMACGLAVIATDCPSGPAEIIRHNENGLLVPKDDVNALSAAMLSLMKDNDLCQRLGDQALLVKTTFCQNSIMTQWDALIKKVSEQ